MKTSTSSEIRHFPCGSVLTQEIVGVVVEDTETAVIRGIEQYLGKT